MTATTVLLTDAEFMAAVENGHEPSGHLSNVRLAWSMYKRHGDRHGLVATEQAIDRRTRLTGGTWNVELTRAWYRRVVQRARRTSSSSTSTLTFEHFLADNPDLLAR